MIEPKLLLYKHKTYSDGTHPVIIQIVIDSKPYRKVISRVNLKQWNARDLKVNAKHPEYNQVNDHISKAMASVRSAIANGAKTKNDIFGKDNNSDGKGNIKSFLDDEIKTFKANGQL